AEDYVTYIMYTEGQARAMRRYAPGAMYSLEIRALADLGAYRAAGFREEQILAWLGTDEPSPGFVSELDDLGVVSILGTLGGSRSLDREMARSRDDSPYSAYAEYGVDIIATDRPRAALKEILSDGARADARRRCGLD
ncbi:MAG: glycerophosphodiester phosphodiesterase, partial [Pseudomonadota bacterium]